MRGNSGWRIEVRARLWVDRSSDLHCEACRELRVWFRFGFRRHFGFPVFVFSLGEGAGGCDGMEDERYLCTLMGFLSLSYASSVPDFWVL